MRIVQVVLLLFWFSASSQTDFAAAEDLFLHGNYEASRLLFEEVVEKHPRNFKALEYIGDSYSHMQQWEQAVPVYARLKNAVSSDVYLYKYGGALAMHARNGSKLRALSLVPDIREAFEAAIRLNPSQIDARWALIELYLQLPTWAGGSESKALQYAKALLAVSVVDSYLANARIAEHYKRFYSAADFYQKAIKAGGSVACYTKLADLYIHKLKQPQRAKQLLAHINNQKRKQ